MSVSEGRSRPRSRSCRLLELVPAPHVQAVAKIDVSSKAKVHQYLRSIHVNPKGVVIQRGQRNYAGPHCPGKGWNCTTARKVIQIATAAQARAGRSFNATGGTNVASCVKLTGSSQTCSIIQVAGNGFSNKATVTQVIGQSGQTLNGTQGAQVTQTSTNGSNTVQLDQVIGQLSVSFAGSVNQSQTSTPTFNITQTSTSGAQMIKATQTSGQAETGPNATAGAQFATGLLERPTSARRAPGCRTSRSPRPTLRCSRQRARTWIRRWSTR